MLDNYQYNSFYDILLVNNQEAATRAIIFEEQMQINNRQLLAYVDTVAGGLMECGIKAGDKVALLMANSWQYVVNIFAISKIGAVAVLINNFLKEDEVAYILNDSQSKLLFASAKFADVAKVQLVKTGIDKIVWVCGAPLSNEYHLDYSTWLNQCNNNANYLARNKHELALIVYTSGTTGKPKGAMLSFANIESNLINCIKRLDAKRGKIKMVCYLPMFHAFTFTATVILPLYTNSGIIIIRSIASKQDFANLLKLVLLKRVPYFVGVPEIYSVMAKAKLPWYFHWLHAVRGFISGAAPLAEETMRNFNANFKRGVLLQGYGISECSPVVAVNVPWENKPGSVGKASPSYQVECFDEQMRQLARGEIGEICVKGDCVMLGYYNRAQETAAVIIDGWFKTGDIGRVDTDGFIFIVDRKKDLIISKGMNIYPREIEEIIYTNAKVNACAVVGVKDNEANEIPVAYVELKDEQKISEAELKAYIKPHLAAFKQPRKIYFMDKLPRNATGKILKRELRELVNQS